MTEVITIIALTCELVIAGLLVTWGIRLMKEGYDQHRKLVR